MPQNTQILPGSPVQMSVGELARRTGVPAATLRTWEARYGLPNPQRLPSGHRRYDEQEVALVLQVLRQRAAGQDLKSSISAARARLEDRDLSVFASLRRLHQDLVPQVLSKATLLAMSRAIEDECCARAERPILFAAFQRAAFYRQSAARWDELARTARSVTVFADFDPPPAPGASPRMVTLDPHGAMRREWVLVCDAPDYPACVVGWEPPGQNHVADAARRFETIWTVDPQVVRDAAHICAELSSPNSQGDIVPVGGPVAAASADVRCATSLLNRMLGYIEQTRP